MTPEVLRYQIPTEQCAAFEAAYRQADEILFNSPHCLGYDLMRCEEAPGQYLMVIYWDSAQGHLDGFCKSAEFARFTELVAPYAEFLQEMRHYVHLEGRDRL